MFSLLQFPTLTDWLKHFFGFWGVGSFTTVFVWFLELVYEGRYPVSEQQFLLQNAGIQS